MERPAQLKLRAEVREYKKQLLGKFQEHGKVFVFFAQVKKIFIDGVLGVGNLLPFAKPRSTGDKLHYEMPMAGHRTAYQRAGLHREEEQRKSILVSRIRKVSSKSFFNRQEISA